MAWNEKFIGGRVNVGHFGACQIEVISKTDNEKKYLYNGGERIVAAWWQNGGVAFETERGLKYVYDNESHFNSL